jgi:hypothetical protein
MKPSITNPCPECSGTRYHLASCSRKPRGIGPKRRQQQLPPRTVAEIEQVARDLIEQGPPHPRHLSAVEDPDEVSFRTPGGAWVTETKAEFAQRQARHADFVKVIQDSMTPDEIAAFTAYHRERGAKCPACGAEAFWIGALMSSNDRAWMTDHVQDCRFLYFDTRQAGNV